MSFTYEPNKHQKVWKLQDAKAQFSHLIQLVCTEGPQRVTRQGKEVAVVVPIEQFDQLTRAQNKQKSLVDFFAESPLAKANINLKRDKSFSRVVNL